MSLRRRLISLVNSVKLKKPGVGTNFCMHKYFFDKSEAWKAVIAEEEATAAPAGDEADDDAEDGGDPTFGRIHFDPIDVRHLSRISLVKARLGKLLKNSPNYTHKTLNLLVTIVSTRTTHLSLLFG